MTILERLRSTWGVQEAVPLPQFMGISQGRTAVKILLKKWEKGLQRGHRMGRTSMRKWSCSFEQVCSFFQRKPLSGYAGRPLKRECVIENIYGIASLQDYGNLRGQHVMTGPVNNRCQLNTTLSHWTTSSQGPIPDSPCGFSCRATDKITEDCSNQSEILLQESERKSILYDRSQDRLLDSNHNCLRKTQGD